MVLRMSRPWRHPQTGIWHWRGRLPTDVGKTLLNLHVTVDVAGEVSRVRLRPITKVSLRTRDPAEALPRHASVQTQLQQRWRAARNGVVTLSNRDVHALAGIWYRDLVTTHRDDPGDPDMLDVYQDHLRDGLAFLDPESDGIEREPYDPKHAIRVLSRLFNIDEFLATRGLRMDEPSRIKLIEQVAMALILGAETLKRRAHGDYSCDEVAKRFPP